MHSNLLLAFRQLIKFYSTSQLVLLFFKDSEHIKLFSAPKHCMGNYCTVIYLLEWSLNQAEGGLMSQTFRVTLPIVAERKLHRGVILFVLKVQLGSDSASARLICVKAGHHIQSTPPDWCPLCGRGSYWSYLSLIHGGVSDEAVSSTAAGNRSEVVEVRGVLGRKELVLRDIKM